MDARYHIEAAIARGTEAIPGRGPLHERLEAAERAGRRCEAEAAFARAASGEIAHAIARRAEYERILAGAREAIEVATAAVDAEHVLSRDPASQQRRAEAEKALVAARRDAWFVGLNWALEPIPGFVPPPTLAELVEAGREILGARRAAGEPIPSFRVRAA